jgi:hypothetical protein
MSPEEKRLWELLADIHRRVQDLADTEARSATVGGHAAQGVLQPAKDDLIELAERILDALEKIHADRA